jgi:Tol biopolymer transport system component
MRKTIFYISFTVLVACAPASREVPQYTIEQFLDNLSIGGGSFSADETKLLVTSNQTGIYNVFALNTDGTGEKQLTFSEGDYRAAISYFPEDDRFLFSSDQGGNEIKTCLYAGA